MRIYVVIAILIAFATRPRDALARPPYLTDDPEPVEPLHAEIDFAAQATRTPDRWTLSAPHVEANFGAITDVQLHVVAPITLVAQTGEPKKYGYGDTELGVKVRFVHETEWIPQIGTFPLLEVPTGAPRIGSRATEVFLPLWLQKSSGAWEAYGGGGYWIRGGEGNRNGWFFGLHGQRRFGMVALGAEVFHLTPSVENGASETGFDVGAEIDFTAMHRLLFSAGAIFIGPSGVQSYLAYQFAFAM